jgi:hypothetical protein
VAIRHSSRNRERGQSDYSVAGRRRRRRRSREQTFRRGRWEKEGREGKSGG